MDVIITTDTVPRFDFHNRDGSGKAFSPVEGTLGVAAIKSILDKHGLVDALDVVATIPSTKSLEGRINVSVKLNGYEDWPLKVVYATRGIAGNKLLAHLTQFYDERPDVPLERRPDFIHVAGAYLIVRAKQGMTIHSRATTGSAEMTIGKYYLMDAEPDLQAIVWTLNQLQQNASASTYIMYSYGNLIYRLVGLS